MRKITLLLLLFITTAVFSQDYTAVIADYLSAHKSENGLSQIDINDFVITSQSFSNSMSVDNVYVDQRFQGILILNTTSSFAIKNGNVVYASFQFKKNIAQQINTRTPLISPEAAIASAASYLQLDTPKILTQLDKDGNVFTFNNGGISLNDIPVALVFQPMETEIRLAWNLHIYLLDASQYYNLCIDAVTGAVLSVDDWVLHCSFSAPDETYKMHQNETSSILEKAHSKNTNHFSTIGGESYRVFPLPIESPNHGSSQVIINPADDNASPFGWHDINGFDGAEYTITRGNNVYAYEDTNGNNLYGQSPDGGVALTFDFPFNLNTFPVNILDATTTNLFYWNNIMHDVWYQYGFDEASGNFQENNYSNGGVDSDSVKAQAQDGSGINKATFLTTEDGSRPLMQMFLWDAPGIQEIILDILNGSLEGEYSGINADFGSIFDGIDMPVLSNLTVIIDDNAGNSQDPHDGCDTILNSSALDGKIAVIRRGGCEDSLKVLFSEYAGAIAAIVVNDMPGDPYAMEPGSVGAAVNIPSIMINQIDGNAIINALLNGENITAQIYNNGFFMIDGALDNGIVAHEYGHGISKRLVGGAMTVNCLNSLEQMGEGWSDWMALMMIMQEEDNRTAPSGIATYVRGQPTDGIGIRPAPYSTDFAVNNYTFNDIDGNVSVPHGVGFVWATMLWEMTWDLVDEYGFDADVYYGTGGNNIAMQLVIDGLKLQECNSGFIAGRDAILQADMLANNGENQCLIWAAFARRGLGFSAIGGSFDDLGDQTEAYDIPSTCSLGIENSSKNKNFVIYPNPANNMVSIKTVHQRGNATITINDLNGREIYSQEHIMEDTVSFSIQSLKTGIYIITIDGNNFSHTEKLIVE